MSAAFRLKGVSAGYGERLVLQNVDLEFPRGGILGLIGPNGAGKSTVLKLLTGRLEPKEGTVEVVGLPPRQARTRVGYVPQSLLLERDLPATMEDLVLSGFAGMTFLWGGATQAEREKVRVWCAKLGIESLLGRKLSALSGGQIQLGLVARALVREPELLLLDEPTANADARAEGAFFGLIEECCKERSAVIVSHDIGVLSRSVGSIACVGAGKIVYHGTTEVPTGALEEAYGCPVELIGHGHPHRVLADHEGHSHS